MNIIFMGTPDFAVPSLLAIQKSKHNILAVVTAPDKPKGRGLKISESPVKTAALGSKLRVIQPQGLKDPEFAKTIVALNADLIVVVAFRILPPGIFTIPKFGSINVHASLLPKYRGAAPINWAIIRGETETGVTTFFLKEKVDTGSIIMQEKLPIDPADNAGTLHDKLMNLGAEMLLKTIDLIEANNGSPPVISQEESGATPAPKIFKGDCRINWGLNAEQVHNHIRGLSPYPGAFTIYKEKLFKIYKSALTNVESLNGAGEIIVIRNDVFVSCADYLLKIEEIQPEGKRRMPVFEFLAGHRFEKGDKFMYLQP